MAKTIYIGVANKARKVKRLYVGINGKARRVKKGYIGIGGKARLFFTKSEFGNAPDGLYRCEERGIDGTYVTHLYKVDPNNLSILKTIKTNYDVGWKGLDSDTIPGSTVYSCGSSGMFIVGHHRSNKPWSFVSAACREDVENVEMTVYSGNQYYQNDLLYNLGTSEFIARLTADSDNTSKCNVIKYDPKSLAELSTVNISTASVQHYRSVFCSVSCCGGDNGRYAIPVYGYPDSTISPANKPIIIGLYDANTNALKSSTLTNTLMANSNYAGGTLSADIYGSQCYATCNGYWRRYGKIDVNTQAEIVSNQGFGTQYTRGMFVIK